MADFMDYLTSDELEQLRVARRLEEDAEKELKRLRAAAFEVDSELTALAARCKAVAPMQAAAEYLGEAKRSPRKQPPPALKDPAELREVLQGLQVRVHQQEEHAKAVRADAEAAMMLALNKGAVRLGEKYVRAANELQEVHGLIAAVNQVIKNAQPRGTGGPQTWLVSDAHWPRLTIPGVDGGPLTAIKKASWHHDGVGPVVCSSGHSAAAPTPHSERQIANALRAAVGYAPASRGN
jgi:hypothetical protein